MVSDCQPTFNLNLSQCPMQKSPSGSVLAMFRKSSSNRSSETEETLAAKAEKAKEFTSFQEALEHSTEEVLAPLVCALLLSLSLQNLDDSQAEKKSEIVVKVESQVDGVLVCLEKFVESSQGTSSLCSL